MHIAHSDQPELFTVEELADRTGLKRRQIAQEARDGKIPGAIRPDGYHYAYPVTPELLDWIEWKRRKVQRRKRPIKTAKVKPTTGVITLQGLRQGFEIWFRRVGGLDGILKMKSEYLHDIISEIQPIARLYGRIAQELTHRDSIKEI
jgi:hypothetical protein